MSLIREYISLSLQEAIRSKTFDLTAFKMEKELNRMHTMIADGGLKLLGQGSSRWVYLLSSGKVLKIANPDAPDRGRAQNQAELKASANGRIRPVVAEVYDHDSVTHNWLISEIVRPYKANDTFFHKTLGIPFSVVNDTVMLTGMGHDLKTIIMHCARNMPKARHGLLQKQTQVFLRGVVALVKDAGMAIGDLGKIDHWGVTGSGRIALLDYGATNEVMAKHYKKAPGPTPRPSAPADAQTAVPGATHR